MPGLDASRYICYSNNEEEEDDDDDDGGGSVLCDSGWGNTVTGMALVMIAEYDM